MDLRGTHLKILAEAGCMITHSRGLDGGSGIQSQKQRRKMMESKKITIELSREDAKMIATLLGSMNAYDTASILSHSGHVDAQEMYDTHSAVQRTYYQLRCAIEGRKVCP